jgi:uncharacterized protein involved in exopolysaccharide biosynthesis
MIRPPRFPVSAAGNGDGVVMTPFAALGVLVRRWRLVVLVPAVCAVVAGAFTLMFREYSARSRFVPQAAGGDMARFAGIAAQMGFSMGGDGAAESPDFYVDLLSSGEILRDAVQKPQSFARRAGSTDTLAGTYLDLLKIKGDTPEERLQNGVDALRESVTASASMKSGVVTLRTTAPWPGLAEALNATILDLLSDFDRERRQAGAHAERVFVEDRLTMAKKDLESAESQMANFLDRNKRPESSRLMMEMERLQRLVGMRQTVYATLAQAYEQARIEEVRNTPVITIVDRPDGSARGKRSPVMFALLGLILGAAAACGLAFALDYLERRAASPEMQELRDALRTMRPSRAAGAAS